MRYYHYFVSGCSDEKDFMLEILTRKKVSSFEDIYKLQNSCAEKLNKYFDEITILNYKLIRKFPY